MQCARSDLPQQGFPSRPGIAQSHCQRGPVLRKLLLDPQALVLQCQHSLLCRQLRRFQQQDVRPGILGGNLGDRICDGEPTDPVRPRRGDRCLVPACSRFSPCRRDPLLRETQAAAIQALACVGQPGLPVDGCVEQMQFTPQRFDARRKLRLSPRGALRTREAQQHLALPDAIAVRHRQVLDTARTRRLDF